MVSMEETHITMTLNERTTRALHSAVVFTLNKWTGQEPIDQEQLIGLKTALQGCVFEFDLTRKIDK
jgi:hypothetical protein